MLKVIVCSLLLVFSTGCLYTNIQIPMDDDFDKTELGTKQGQAETHTVLYLVSWGDAGSRKAAEAGGIKVIRHADRKIFSILFGLYTEVTTVVYGD